MLITMGKIKRELPKIVGITLIIFHMVSVGAVPTNTISAETNIDSLGNEFVNPPDHVRQGVFWQWNGGMISREGLTLDGAWEIAFASDWGAPEKVTFPEVISWTDSEEEGIKYYSGTATYEKIFQYNEEPDPSKHEKVYLDLGEISKVGEVWLNGKSLGITWSRPYRFDVTNILEQGENTIVIEVANTWSNRLTGDALTGENYTNTNILKTIIPASLFEIGDQTRLPWDKVPLIKSGLIGPVSIQRITGIQNE